MYGLSIRFNLYIFVYFSQFYCTSLCILHIAFWYTNMYYIVIARNKQVKEITKMKVIIGSEKQIKWANDIIAKASEAIERFDLYKIKEAFDENDNASWFIENYAFATKARRTDVDTYIFFRDMISKEFALRTEGLKRREIHEIIMNVFKPMFDEIEEQYML